MAPTSPTTSKVLPQPRTESQTQTYQSQDLVASLPAPIFRLLVIFSRPIALLRASLEVLCWKGGKRVESWIVVGSWWGICLGAGHAFRFLFPALVFLPLLPLSTIRLRKEGPPKPAASSAAQPTTTEAVLITLNDLHSINSLLPPSPVPTVSSIYARFRQLGSWRLTRGLFVIWTTWIILGYITGYRVILALIGTVILLLPSPTLAHLVDLLSKSLAVRRGVALLFVFTFGSPPEQAYRFSLDFSPLGWLRSKWAVSRRPSLAFSFRPTFNKEEMGPVPSSAIEDDELPEEKAGEPIYFRFEVHENQRWWMGLDWTSALLPQERPSWCDSHLLPVSPPASFSLPAPSSIILPAPTKSDPNVKIKRTATWQWLDDDWSVVRVGAGLAVTPAMAPSPVQESDNTFSPSLLQAQSQAQGSTQSTHGRSYSFSLGTSPPMGSDDTFGNPTGNSTAASASSATSARTQSIAEQAFTKGLERLKARTASPAAKPSPTRTSGELQRPRTGSQASEDSENASTPLAVPPPMEVIREKDDATDAEGWVYGDNKWENMGAKGGLGRFTRRRRWHRRAVCIETVERLSSDLPSSTTTEGGSSDPVPRMNLPATPSKSGPTLASISAGGIPLTYGFGSSVDHQDNGAGAGVTQERVTVIPASPARDDVLRQRLKKAMGSMGG